jgi:hypothetical protein
MTNGFTIDITPTWRGIVPALVEVASKGETAEGRKMAMDELLRLADIADHFIIEQKNREDKK